MSYDILYDRRFIKITEKGYIPIIQIGSSNTFEYSYSGKEVPEKIWMNLKIINPKKEIFSEGEILKMAKDLEKEAESGAIMKTRYTPFKPGEITRWFKSGIKNAKTLEEYISWGNKLIITKYDDYTSLYPTTTEELLNEIIVSQLTNTEIELSFRDRDFKVPKKNAQNHIQKTLKTHPYIIDLGDDYLHHLGKHTYYVTPFPEAAKKFKTEKETQKYIDKYKEKFPSLKEGKIININDKKTKQLSLL